MHNSLLTGEKEQKSQRRFSILAPDTQAQVCVLRLHLDTWLKTWSHWTRQNNSYGYNHQINTGILLFLKIASKSEGISDFWKN